MSDYEVTLVNDNSMTTPPPANFSVTFLLFHMIIHKANQYDHSVRQQYPTQNGNERQQPARSFHRANTAEHPTRQEFYVRFKGPAESQYALLLAHSRPMRMSAWPRRFTYRNVQQLHSKAASGKSVSSYPTSTHTSPLASAS